jgi:beta-xylosidase
MIQTLEPARSLTQPAHPWLADRGDGTYCNPVLYADYSDPDVIRVGDDYYLVASSFNCTPGLPILHSKDLVNWTLIGHALKNLPDTRYEKVRHGEGVWAPAIRFHAGKYWIFYSTPDEGLFLITAHRPAGPWSEPHCVQAGKGLIDPCPLWDDDGKAYLVHAYAGSRAGIKHRLRVCPMVPDGSKLLDKGEVVFHQPEKHPTLEGPKFYKRNGWYYIFAPAGGVKTGWQTVLRSKNIFGPYENKIVLAQGKTEINGPHQGGWVETQAGESWFLHFQDCDACGRIVHLQPMQWLNDWPVIGDDADGDGIGEPVSIGNKPNVGKNHPAAAPQTSDEFDAPGLGLQWQWHANFSASWFSLSARPGWLRLYSAPLPVNATNSWSVPHLLLQKFPAPEFTAGTKLDFSRLAIGEKAGLVVMGIDYAQLAVERTAQGFRLVKTVCQNAPKGGAEIVEAETPVTGGSILLRLAVRAGAVCHFSFSCNSDDGFSELGENFTAREGVWIGAKLGLFCVSDAAAKNSGHADFDWFRFEK